MEGRFQRVSLLDRSIRLYDQEACWSQPYGLNIGGSTHQQTYDLHEKPDLRARLTIPMIKNGDKPVRIWCLGLIR